MEKQNSTKKEFHIEKKTADRQRKHPVKQAGRSTNVRTRAADDNARKTAVLSLVPTSRNAALIVLDEVLIQGAYTNIALNRYLAHHKEILPDNERRLATELVYGTVKALGTLDWYLTPCVSRPLAQLDSIILNILRLAVYQILFMARIPQSAAVNEAVNQAKALSHAGSAKFVNGVLRGFLRKLEAGTFVLPDPEKQDADFLAIKYCHPRWLIKRWLGPWGREGTEALLQFDNSAAPVCLRTNTLVMTRDELLKLLVQAGGEVHASKWSKDGIVADKLPSLSMLLAQPGLKQAFYVQDESSMLVAPVLDAQPGMKVLDLCSAPGGKATHIAQMMGDKGEVIACDIHEHKLKLIRENADRLGMKSIKPMLNDATQLRQEWLHAFDRVLVDAPCSGLGVLRRRAEARWRKTRADLKTFPPLQLAILENAVQYVKEGGYLVYSTCTIEQSENHYLVEEFLNHHPEWRRAGFAHPLTGEKVEELQLLPQKDAIDGFYICLLERVK